MKYYIAVFRHENNICCGYFEKYNVCGVDRGSKNNFTITYDLSITEFESKAYRFQTVKDAHKTAAKFADMDLAYAILGEKGDESVGE